MFEDDPEMQAMVARAKAEPKPMKAPLHVTILYYTLFLLGGVATYGVAVLLVGHPVHPAMFAFGALAGGMVSSAIFGLLPGRYRVIETDEKLTLWKPITPAWRALCGAGAIASLGVGVFVLAHDLGKFDDAPPPPNHAAAPQPTPPPLPAKPPAAAPAKPHK